VRALLARQDWIGWVAVGLLGLAVFALVMIILREAAGLARLGRLGRIRHEADSAARDGDKALAVDVTRRLKCFYRGRKDVAWGLARLAEHESDIMDAAELLRLTERTLVAPLDAPARAIVAASAKRVSVVTAVSPGALIDMLFVAGENLRMLRRLATLYGARPHMLSLLKLARMVVTHIVLTGGIALGDDVIQQLLGHGLTAKLSARLGEGLFNGALTTRIGIAAIDVCRPLPYIEVPRPRFRELVAEVAGLG
jgi:putative membrane protein